MHFVISNINVLHPLLECLSTAPEYIEYAKAWGAPPRHLREEAIKFWFGYELDQSRQVRKVEFVGKLITQQLAGPGRDAEAELYDDSRDMCVWDHAEAVFSSAGV